MFEKSIFQFRSAKLPSLIYVHHHFYLKTGVSRNGSSLGYSEQDYKHCDMVSCPTRTKNHILQVTILRLPCNVGADLSEQNQSTACASVEN